MELGKREFIRMLEKCGAWPLGAGSGVQGPKGDTGDAGPQGPQGAQGAKGDKGDPGDAGAAGAQGPAGPQGAAGAQGPKGDTGDAGAVGAQGPAGPQGTAGAPGSAGAQGPKGDTGAQGIQGPQGNAGAQGIQGIQGPAGADGAPGAQGVAGPAGSIGNANTADVVANAADTYLAGSDLAIAGKIKAGTIFRWRFTFTKTAAGVAQPVFNVRVGTAGSVADAARCTFTTLAQTGAIDTGIAELEVIVRNAGNAAAGRIQGELSMRHKLTTTGLANAAQEQLLQALSATFDLTLANLKIGVSVNPGSLGVWTFQTISVAAFNLV